MIQIRGAEIYDPANGIAGKVGDLWVEGEQIIQSPEGAQADEVIDARGMILAPGAVEIHTHVAGSSINTARRFLSGDPALLDLLTPSAEVAARRYLALGYTTLFEAACPPLMARLASIDLRRMSCLDRGSFTQLGDQRLLLEALIKGDLQEVRDTLSWLLQISGGYAVKLVNPGGGVAWKAGLPPPGLDETFGAGELTQRNLIYTLVRLVNEMGMPHPVHLHAGKLGLPGNADSFCRLIRALEGQRAHLCHIQFYSYGQDELGRYTSAAEEVARCLETAPTLTCDVGQVVFGAAMAVTNDTSGLYNLQKSTSKPWISRQFEGEGGVNVLPLAYAAKDAASAVQWATGLELLLRSPDPTRIFLTTDHPNGAPFSAYPQIIEWLMSRPARQEALEHCHPAAKHKTGMGSIEREYSLAEIFSMTSWGPARALGLTDRGHLGAGALADLRCYRKQADTQAMFAQPAWVMHRGKVTVREGKFVEEAQGRMLTVQTGWDEDRRKHLENSMQEWLSFPARDYGLGAGGLEGAEEVKCTSTAS